MGKAIWRAGAGVVAGALVAALLVSGPATAAKPAKPGAVTGLALAISHPDANYRVEASWDALDGATRYRVTMTDASGTSIPTESTTSTVWAHTSTAAAGTTVSVTVVPFVGKFRGKAAKVSAILPDVTAPQAAYSVLREVGNPTSGNVTLQQDLLSDDLDAVTDLTQEVDWGDGSSESWSPVATTISHSYPGDKMVYYPVVTVTDRADNSSTFHLVVAVSDTQAPDGIFSVGPGGFAGWTSVTVVQNLLSDDLSSPEHITRTVDWGDGSAPEPWTTGDTISHVYALPGSFTPAITLTDEAGNAAVVYATAVAVAADTLAPTLRIVVPKHRKSVRAWTRVHGRSADGAGTGVKVVRLKVVEKRTGVWYVYRFTAHRWAKVGTHKAAALRKARATRLHPNDLNRWGSKVLRLRKGVLVVRAVSVDNVGNKRAKVVQQRLTRR